MVEELYETENKSTISISPTTRGRNNLNKYKENNTHKQVGKFELLTF